MGTKTATKEEWRETETSEMADLELTNCEKVVALAKAEFGEGRLAEEATWQAVVLIPKGGYE